MNIIWIYEHQDWPVFTWNVEKLASKLADIRYRQGRLLGRMQGLGFSFQREATLVTLTNDVVKSSLIEGERLQKSEVRSSIGRRLGMDLTEVVTVGRDVEGIVELMLDATQKFSKPLTKNRIAAWHASLFPTGRSGLRRITVGGWRAADGDPMQVVSGPMGQEKVHYQAPSARQLEQEMMTFLTWFDAVAEIDPVIKAGIAHLWFVSIHPFEDGNGRIARAITDMALARADGMSNRFYSVSTQMEKERKTYYRQLEMQQRSGPDLTLWLGWFLDCLGRAIDNADSVIHRVLFKAQLWEKANQGNINARQRLVINRMLEDDFKGFINTSKYTKLAKCSPDTALRDIQSLKAQGILLQNPKGGRSTSYRLPEKIEP